MNHLDYFKKINAQKQINKLAKKYKNKKIVIYGNGIYFQALNENYDLSKLNIVAIADKKFEADTQSNTSAFAALKPTELKDFDFDILLTALYDDNSLTDYLEYELLINSKNEGKPISSIVKPTLWFSILVLLGVYDE